MEIQTNRRAEKKVIERFTAELERRVTGARLAKPSEDNLFLLKQLEELLDRARNDEAFQSQIVQIAKT